MSVLQTHNLISDMLLIRNLVVAVSESQTGLVGLSSYNEDYSPYDAAQMKDT